jgi:hypothetical protein
LSPRLVSRFGGRTGPLKREFPPFPGSSSPPPFCASCAFGYRSSRRQLRFWLLVMVGDELGPWPLVGPRRFGSSLPVYIELELAQSHMAQKPMLRGEVGGVYIWIL